ncbi:MAG: energy transducer TonB [Terracidiphilus sp.]
MALGSVLLFGDICAAQKDNNQIKSPTEIVIARDSFIDVGPPFNYYDLTFLRSQAENTDVERISLTPPADACYPRAEIEVAHVLLKEPLSDLLENVNPCRISEKALKAELKRRNKGLVFSGMNVSIQVQCGARMRVIRADILDRDIFDEHPRTPQYTSWSRTIFEKLDKATGQSPWDKPVFAVDATPPAAPTLQSSALQAIADGKFDEIFGDVPDRPSGLYRLAQNPPRQPFIEMTKSDPVRPTIYVDPIFPPIAKAARVHGNVDFHMVIGSDGAAKDAAIDSGPKMLWQTTLDAIAKWKFAADDSGKAVQGSIRFGLNCSSDAK